MFTEISNEVVEFVPDYGSNTNKKFTSTSTETERTPPQLDKCMNSKKMISVEVNQSIKSYQYHYALYVCKF